MLFFDRQCVLHSSLVSSVFFTLHPVFSFGQVEPRKGMIVSFVAADVLFGPSLGGIYTAQRESYRQMHAALKEWAPGREHIVPTGDEVKQTWTGRQNDGPDHLGLWFIGLHFSC